MEAVAVPSPEPGYWHFWDFKSKKAITSVGRVRDAGVQDKTEFAF
jgi:hypothetical protein